MVIGNFQVQHVLRSYSRQLSQGSRVSKSRTDKKSPQNDEVMISSESKKRLLADKITKEMMSQFSGSSELTETGRAILERLSREYGQPLELSRDLEGNATFLVSDQAGARESTPLAPSENEDLMRKLFDITRSTVYNDLV